MYGTIVSVSISQVVQNLKQRMQAFEMKTQIHTRAKKLPSFCLQIDNSSYYTRKNYV